MYVGICISMRIDSGHAQYICMMYIVLFVLAHTDSGRGQAQGRGRGQAQGTRTSLLVQPLTPLPSRFVKYDGVCLAPPTPGCSAESYGLWSMPADLRIRERLYVRRHMYIHAY